MIKPEKNFASHRSNGHANGESPPDSPTDPAEKRPSAARNGSSANSPIRHRATRVLEYARLEHGKTPAIPEHVYDALPHPLGEACRAFTAEHERATFLVGALGVLSGCLPNVTGLYGGSMPKWNRPNLYAAVVAPAASGKGALHWADRLGASVDTMLRQESAQARSLHADRVDAAESGIFTHPGNLPPDRSLYVPVNTSAAAFHEALKDRAGRAVMVATEIDTLTSAVGQDWGKFDDSLRAAYHHERISFRRKSEGETVIESPSLSVVLSGTPDQFQRLIPCAEDGLYSRFLLYQFGAGQQWISQQPTTSGQDQIAAFDGYADRVLLIYEELRARTERLPFTLTGAQWQRHAEVFSTLLKTATKSGAGDLVATIKRAGVVAFRTAMIISVLRVHNEGEDLSTLPTLAVSENDFNTILTLTCIYCTHALSYAADRLKRDPQAERLAFLLRHFAGCEFKSRQYYELAVSQKTSGVEAFQYSRRTFERDLPAWQEAGHIEAVHGNGLWRVPAE